MSDLQLRTGKHFNPRSPHGERHDADGREIERNDISTHAPRTGSDARRSYKGFSPDISTHAPRTGSDPGG